MSFKLTSNYQPAGDQPRAIKELLEGIQRGDPSQTLLGVTGSGKTFTIANVIAGLNKPTLVLSHNKTLAAQLYSEFKQFFPENAVEYFISYYDYYQPEAYIPTSNTYIEKDLSINEEIEKLRLHTTSQLVTGRRDIIVVASVSCIYGIGNPDEFEKSVLRLTVGDVLPRSAFLFSLVNILYSRTEVEFKRGTFRVKGDTVDVFPAYADFAYRFMFFDDQLEAIWVIDPVSSKKIREEKLISVFPANLFVTGKESLNRAVREIQDDLVQQVKFFEAERRFMEAKRVQERTEFDLEMMRELGYCNGIENYSRYFDRRSPGQRPFCLIDYFPDDFLLVIDESHVTIPQVRGMWGGDRSRKENLVDYGFRLPSALDNRPLNFNEFEDKMGQVIFVSATPAEYELRRSDGVVVEQLIRPTGLLDPKIDVRSSKNQVDDLIEEIQDNIKRKERVLITTLTKRMAEELSKYLSKLGINTRYIHSEVKSLDRVEILRELRLGVFDVLVGVNLLREGLDLPEVSLVAIMDADKEGFLRNQRSLIQTIGRAARNSNGRVIMYADQVTESMQQAIDETNRRRLIQENFNKEHHITPITVKSSKDNVLEQSLKGTGAMAYVEPDSTTSIAADPVMEYLNENQLEKLIKETKKRMEQAAKELDFMEAARLRDEFFELQKRLTDKTDQNSAKNR
jgi:excinuclease ABC subunit B